MFLVWKRLSSGSRLQLKDGRELQNALLHKPEDAVRLGRDMRAPEPWLYKCCDPRSRSPSPRWCDPNRKSQPRTLTIMKHGPQTFFLQLSLRWEMSNIWLPINLPQAVPVAMLFCRLVNVISITSITLHYLLPSRSFALSDDNTEHKNNPQSACRVLPVPRPVRETADSLRTLVPRTRRRRGRVWTTEALAFYGVFFCIPRH